MSTNSNLVANRKLWKFNADRYVASYQRKRNDRRDLACNNLWLKPVRSTFVATRTP